MKRTRTFSNRKGYSYEVTTNKPLTDIMAKKRLIQLYGGTCSRCGHGLLTQECITSVINFKARGWQKDIVLPVLKNGKIVKKMIEEKEELDVQETRRLIGP